jgi:CBS domain-containing protein
VSRLSEEAKDPKTELTIAIVGPLTSFALALFFWVLNHFLVPEQFSFAHVILSYLTWINMAVGIFNLIPGFPLDGGRVLRAFLWYRSGSLTRATRTASHVGKGFAIVLMLLGALQIFTGALLGGLWLIFIGMFLRGTAEGGYQEVVLRQALADVAVHEVMTEDVISVPQDLPVSRLLTEYFLHYGYHGFPVTQNGQVIGVVSLNAVRQVPESERPAITVAQIMRPLSGHITIAPQAPLSEALNRWLGQHPGRVRLALRARNGALDLQLDRPDEPGEPGERVRIPLGPTTAEGVA